jgi:hypothetical protein
MGHPPPVTGFMKIEPKPSDREVLAGLVERVTFHNEENGFCVLRRRNVEPPHMRDDRQIRD